MILEIDSAALPRPIVIDLDAPKGDGPSPLAVLKPVIRVLPYEGSAPAISWAPYGAPTSHALAFLWIAGISLAVAFVAVGIARSR